MSIWSEFKQSDDRWKPENPGDTIAGELIGLRVATMPDQTRIPQLTIRTDEGKEVSVLASQAQLQSKLAAIDPQVGSRIAIKFTHVEQRAGGRTLKHFDIGHKPGEPKPSEATAASSPSASDLI